MLFLAHMKVDFPSDLNSGEIEKFKNLEKEYSKKLQESGIMKGIWRIAGEYANYSIYDVENNDKLHEIMEAFPMYKYMNIKITPLSKHPNATEVVAY